MRNFKNRNNYNEKLKLENEKLRLENENLKLKDNDSSSTWFFTFNPLILIAFPVWLFLMIHMFLYLE